MKNIGQPTLDLPAEVPVMPLPNAVLFPHALLPLHMFEDRYRQMLVHCLERERIFCVALMKPGVSEAADEHDFFPVAGLGLIRACIGNADGTSNLVLQGLTRVELVETVETEPFRVARVRQVPSEVSNAVEADALALKVIELCRELKEKGAQVTDAFANELPHMTSAAALSDVVAHTFLTDALQRQALLAEPQVTERLRMLIGFLQRLG